MALFDNILNYHPSYQPGQTYGQNLTGSVGTSYHPPQQYSAVNSQINPNSPAGYRALLNSGQLPNNSMAEQPVNLPQPPPQQPTLPNSFTGTPTGGGSSSVLPFSKLFQGTLYNDPNAYKNAYSNATNDLFVRQMAAMQRNYDTSLRGYSQNHDLLNQQLGNSDFNYKNSLTDLSNSRDAALNSQNGYFSVISPDAIQSGQQVYAGKTNDQFNQGKSQLDLQHEQGNQAINQQLGNLGQEEKNYQAGYQDNLNQLNLNKQSLLDDAGNQANDYAARVAASNRSYAANVPQYNTTDLLNRLASLYLGNQKFGNSYAQNQSSVAAELSKTGIPQSQQSSISNYLYNQFLPQVPDYKTPIR